MNERVLSYNDLLDRGIRYTRVHLNRLSREGKFPAAIHLGQHRIAWRESEINDWLAACERVQASAPHPINGHRQELKPAPPPPVRRPAPQRRRPPPPAPEPSEVSTFQGTPYLMDTLKEVGTRLQTDLVQLMRRVHERAIKENSEQIDQRLREEFDRGYAVGSKRGYAIGYEGGKALGYKQGCEEALRVFAAEQAGSPDDEDARLARESIYSRDSRILELLANHTEGLTSTEVAYMLEMGKSTARAALLRLAREERIIRTYEGTGALIHYPLRHGEGNAT